MWHICLLISGAKKINCVKKILKWKLYNYFIGIVGGG